MRPRGAAEVLQQSAKLRCLSKLLPELAAKGLCFKRSGCGARTSDVGLLSKRAALGF